MNKYAHFILQQIRWSVGSVLLVLLALIFLTGLLPSDLQKVYAEENCIYLDEEMMIGTEKRKQQQFRALPKQKNWLRIT